MKRILIFFIITFLAVLLLNFGLIKAFAISGYGSNGEEVKKIQEKLKNWGYYDGEIDGEYGSKTFNAVKKFQEKNGLKADGIAGSQTLSALRDSI